ncbi:MAG: hypothetical protein ACFFEY_18550, partial [Candidatus Thorarchaeota archaeon]
ELTGDKFDPHKEYLVKNKNLKAIRNELKKGNIVISDDLNYYSSMRHDLKEIADLFRLHYFIIHISTPLAICIKWNEERGKPIPNIVINRISDKFDKFNKYKWDKPFMQLNLSEIADIKLEIKKVLRKIDHDLKSAFEKEKKFPKYNIYNESLDKITRIQVSKLLLNPKYLSLKKRIIKLRKSYVKAHKNKYQTDSEISRSFKKYLKNNLEI